MPNITANRIRQAFGTRSDITERKMSGGLAFLYLGRMCCGIVGRDLLVRIPDDEFVAVMRGRSVTLGCRCAADHPERGTTPARLTGGIAETWRHND